MKVQSVFTKNVLVSLWQSIVLALLFSICYTQKPLYTQNQNTKFLYGLANAGVGFLKEDWLANTIDPLPVFSFLVRVTYSYLNDYTFYFYYFIILGVYLYSNLEIISIIFKINNSRSKYLTYLALIIAFHCIHIKIFRFDTGFHLHSGVAFQYILGSYFQPSTFGVFLVYSIYLFLRKKPYLAVSALAFSATVHSTYLISAAILTLGYMIVLYKEEGSLKKVLFLGLFAFIAVLPVLSYTYIMFASTSSEMLSQAHYIIVNFRIPHHSIPKYWLKDSTAYIQALIVFYAIHLVRKTRLFVIMFLPALTATIATLIQFFVYNPTLAFIAPWRFSAFLVPISTFIITAYWLSKTFDKFQKQISKNRKLVTSLSLVVIFILLIEGAAEQVDKFTKPNETKPMMDFVKKTRYSGETYLIPFDVPNVLELIFPPVRRANKILNLDQFRLYTGVPIFINFKSHPYKDREVLEWYKRVLIARRFYENKDNKSCDLLKNISVDYKITHVIFQKDRSYTQCTNLEKLYEDNIYVVYRIRL